MTFKFLLKDSKPEEAFLDENLAKFGDALVNLIYSLARSVAKGEPDGAKVPNRVLSDALSESGLRDLAPPRSDRHELGDFAEAMIAYAWIENLIEIEEASEILVEPLKKIDFQKRKEIHRGSKKGFKKLMVTISSRINIGKS